MAEITAQDLYNQLTPLEKQQYDGVMGMGGFKQKYEENPTSQFVLGDANYAKFKPIADAEKAIPEKGFFKSLISSASAAEPDKTSSVSGTPGFEVVANPDGTISIVPVDTSSSLPFNVGDRLFNQFNTATTLPNQTTFDRTIFPTNVQTGIMTQAPTPTGVFLDNAGLPTIDTSFGVANEPDDPDDVERATNTKKGIASLFEFLSKFPTPLNLLRRGLESLSGINQRIRATDFGRSTSFADFFQKKRDRKAREDAAKRGADKQRIRDLRAFNEGAGQYFSGRNDGNSGRAGGFGQGAGSFSSSDPTATEGSF